jgi:hypothetical protein
VLPLDAKSLASNLQKSVPNPLDSAPSIATATLFSETIRKSRAKAALRRATRALDFLIVSEVFVAVAIDGFL